MLVALLALLTFQAGLRAHRDGLGSAKAVVAASLALLVRAATLGATSAGWIGRATSMTVLQLAILTFALALGWVMLSRLKDLRKATEAAQSAQLAAATRQAQELEGLVQMRNAELSARLNDLGDARRAAELANDGLQRALEQLEEAASTDRLTGAWNRRRFEEAALPELALAQRRRDPLSLLMFDLDHFKRVNDTFGHGAGDAVLVGLVQTVRQHLRASDSLIRWGGEEFLVMVPATRLEGAMALAEKMRAAVAAIDFPGIGQVTMSLGVAQYAPGESLSAWIERADQALYRAKSEGRNRSLAAPMPEHLTGAFPGRSLLEVVWDDAYESGNALIDKQHRRLFHLANSLMAVLTVETPLSEVSLRLETLLAHTSQHFHDEEALLREAHYPDLAKHATIHANLLARARQLQADVQEDQLDFGKLVTFLALDLVKGHFLAEDQNYFERLHRLENSGDAQSA
jgi:diguanylate cyclase (GGDEF)-like protein/hemerythrin-like metal-binding protein